MLFDAEVTRSFAVEVALAYTGTFIKFLFSLANCKLNFDTPALKIKRQRNQRAAFFLDFTCKALYFLFVQ